MHNEIATIPAVIDDQISNLRAPLREIAEELGPRVGEIILTGCGDSHYAGIATKLAFERTAGVRCRPVEALELARYDVRYVPSEPPPLLVAVSYSGEVGRTIEAASAAERFGWHTVALTGRSTSRLARAVRRRVLMNVPTLGFSPGTSTYVAMLTALLVLAAELARVRGRTAQAAALNGELSRAASLAAETLDRSEEPAAAAATAVAEAPVTTFLGAGPSRASAAFGAAKLFEGPQCHGVAQDLEEWAHEQYFVSGPRTPIVVVAPSGAAHDRALELLAEMAFIRAPAFLVTDGAAPEGLALTGLLPVAAGLSEAASPLLTCLPLALLGFFVAERLGKRSYGFPSAEQEEEHYATIHRDSRSEPA